MKGLPFLMSNISKLKKIHIMLPGGLLIVGLTRGEEMGRGVVITRGLRWLYSIPSVFASSDIYFS